MLIGLVFCATEAKAQVTATARVTLTVLPAPGMNFTTGAVKSRTSTVAVQKPAPVNPSVTFQSPGNVMVQLKSSNLRSSEYNLSQGEMKTFSAKELQGVSSVEIDYLGS